MRKTSYVLTALAVIFTTVLTIISLTRVDWVVARYRADAINSIFEAKYGLSTVCTRLEVKLPGGDRSRYEDEECRPFPTRKDDGCDDDNQSFCAMWASARYATEVAIGFGALALVAIAIGVSTHSRRRRIWKAAAGLVTIHALLALTAFALILDQVRMSRFPTFRDGHLGAGFWLTTVAWVSGILVAVGVIATGIAADRGHRWAAGNRAYQPILG
ncbi:hypothetical protein MIND_00080900 [Mycena indigotica]|uniref:Uncharacterized protein n=1 Tax=Mycena indigotica TaxID=2126181 RepID=A0A8H6WKE7_9AGAR|nr:uncharacterized protein MIND_00080900 [Mycena indigotica]KAF7315654.1 hypothetical protein MIND_00080900 [Mycena indigotica]